MMYEEFVKLLEQNGENIISREAYKNVIEYYYSNSLNINDVGGKQQMIQLYLVIGLKGIAVLCEHMIIPKMIVMDEVKDTLEEELEMIRLDYEDSIDEVNMKRNLEIEELKRERDNDMKDKLREMNQNKEENKGYEEQISFFESLEFDL